MCGPASSTSCPKVATFETNSSFKSVGPVTSFGPVSSLDELHSESCSPSCLLVRKVLCRTSESCPKLRLIEL